VQAVRAGFQYQGQRTAAFAAREASYSDVAILNSWMDSGWNGKVVEVRQIEVIHTDAFHGHTVFEVRCPLTLMSTFARPALRTSAGSVPVPGERPSRNRVWLCQRQASQGLVVNGLAGCRSLCIDERIAGLHGHRFCNHADFQQHILTFDFVEPNVKLNKMLPKTGCRDSTRYDPAEARRRCIRPTHL